MNIRYNKGNAEVYKYISVTKQARRIQFPTIENNRLIPIHITNTHTPTMLPILNILYCTERERELFVLSLSVKMSIVRRKDNGKSANYPTRVNTIQSIVFVGISNIVTEPREQSFPQCRFASYFFLSVSLIVALSPPSLTNPVRHSRSFACTFSSIRPNFVCSARELKQQMLDKLPVNALSLIQCFYLAFVEVVSLCIASSCCLARKLRYLR